MTNGVFNESSPAESPDDNGLDPATLQKRFNDSQAYIAQLEREAAEKLEAIRVKEEALETERMLREALQKAAPNPPPSREAIPAAQEPAKPLNEDDLVERVLKAQEQRTAKAQAEANAQTVVDRLTELYGSQEAANKIVVARAAELGVGVNFLLEAAKTSPSAFYDLMKLETAPKSDPAPRGDVNPAALKTHAPGVKEGTNAFYEQLRKEIGDARYYTPKIQQQRFRDAQRLGEAFFT